jgi:acetoin utilization deacetylase AcuC-like enzyme
MDAWYSEHHLAHHGHNELMRGQLLAGFEAPVRAERVRDAFAQAKLGVLREPADHGLAPILAVHDAGYVDFLRNAWNQWRALGRTHPALGMIWSPGLAVARVPPRHIDGALGYYSIDAGSAIVEGTWDAAYWSAQVALSAAGALAGGARASFAICRPPGHHATARAMGGYCYLNNAAIAAQALLDAGCAKVAVIDIDYHHGNGTQAIFWARDDVFFASLHADPHTDYPYLCGHAHEVGEGRGRGHTLNLPLPAGTEAPSYLAALEIAIDAARAHAAAALVVSLGVDTFERDPISGFKLRGDDYLEIGRRLRRIALPALFVFEGGYATDEVGTNAVAVLIGFERG